MDNPMLGQALLAVGSQFDWSSGLATIQSFNRKHNYYWSKGKIVHPLSYKEETARRKIAEAAFQFLAYRYGLERKGE